MKKSEIKFTISLDEHNIPEKIEWENSDRPGDAPAESKAVCLSMWDQEKQNTLKLDLWTKEMPVDEMKRFFIEAIGGMGESLKNATNDEYMTSEIDNLCDRLGKHLEQETKSNE